MKKTIGFVIFIIIGVLLSSGFYIVREDEVAVVDAFGGINRAIIDQNDYDEVSSNLADAKLSDRISIIPSKGLKFKIPFIENVTKYDSKYLTYKSDMEIVNTKDSKRIEINMYAQYRVIDPVKFKQVVGNKATANTRMDETVYSEVVKACNSLNQNEFFYENKLEELLDQKHMELNDQMIKQFGIYISDIGIYRKNFPAKNVTSIEQKMISQIEKESRGLIAQGDALYITKTAETDLEAKTILAQAVEKSAQIKADADAEAVRIYTEALSRDLEFYQFIQRMDIYKNMEDTTVFVEDDGIFNMVDGYSLD